MDVTEEQQRVLNGSYAPDSPLVVKQMRKVYGSGKEQKIAVKDVSFAVEKGVVFGLYAD